VSLSKRSSSSTFRIGRKTVNMSGFDARIDESSESDSRSRSGLRVEASSVHVAITSSSSLSFSSPEVQRSGVLPLGTAI
jgi:hypothetical protein